MTRARCSGRTAAVASVATLSVAALVAGATGAMAGSAPASVKPSAAAVQTTTIDVCKYPNQGLRVGIRLTLRSETDNDIKQIRVRATSKNEDSPYYKRGVTIKSLKIYTYQTDGDATGVQTFTKTASPAYVTLNPATTGAEIDKVKTVTRFKMPDGSTATANCTVTLEDSN